MLQRTNKYEYKHRTTRVFKGMLKGQTKRKEHTWDLDYVRKRK